MNDRSSNSSTSRRQFLQNFAVAAALPQVDQLVPRNPLFCRAGAGIFPLHCGFNFSLTRQAESEPVQ